MKGKAVFAGLLAVFLLLSLNPCLGTGAAAGDDSMTGSVITKTLREMLDSYYAELAQTRAETEGMDADGKEYIQSLLEDVEGSLQNVEFYYSEGEYNAMNKELKEAEDGLVKAKRELALIKLVTEKKKETPAQLYSPLFIALCILIIAGLYLLVKLFIAGRQIFKVGRVDLSLIGRQVRRDTEKDKIPLNRRIERLEEKVKRSGKDRKLRAELELIREKYRQGLLGMCEDYIEDMERELKGGNTLNPPDKRH